ncbi:MAG: DNA polymerase domain-containing protein [Candidatus Bathyarchaeia archaeon]|nr:hypothetical protein [Candidatus Bathyarchaeota archaeon]
MGTVDGWIIDLYRKGNFMVVWLKEPDGNAVRIIDTWRQHIFVAGERRDLLNLAEELHVEDIGFDEKFVRPEDDEPSIVLKIPVENNWNAEQIARMIMAHGGYRRYELYNVDVAPSQLYMYEKGIYPFGYLQATSKGDTVCWKLKDSLESTDYEIPPLRKAELSVKTSMKGRLQSLSDPIESITVRTDDEDYCIDLGDEGQKLITLSETIKEIDPDIIYTVGGDKFIFPYLSHRAIANNVLEQFTIDRESTPLKARYGEGQTYISYGRIYHRPAPTRIPGRIHIDIGRYTLYKECGLHGIIEVARLCRIPVQRVIDTTIGTSMTSAQLYEATSLGILIPWRKTYVERLKTARELLTADRGGFYYEPIVGLHESVGELDFTSLYPTIMFKKNISGETIRCECCPDSKNRVPELDYNICERRVGIVPRSLGIILEKRRLYKELRQRTFDQDTRKIYEMRQAALKWILVCAFGYLGFKNARFGRIDAHIATCAFARKILTDAAHLAESRGFKIIHGIVDSLWLWKEDAQEDDYRRLKFEVEEATGFPVTFEGVYRWIVFLPSKIHSRIPVLNRYYGVLKDGRIKDRGIATRRGDMPPIIKRCIWEILDVLAEARNAREFYEKLRTTPKIINRYIRMLREGVVPVEMLTIQKRLSKKLSSYKNKVCQAIAAEQLSMGGGDVRIGEDVSYIIVNSRSKIPSRRVLASALVKGRTYDADAYVNLLLSAVETMLKPFHFTLKPMFCLNSKLSVRSR